MPLKAAWAFENLERRILQVAGAGGVWAVTGQGLDPIDRRGLAGLGAILLVVANSAATAIVGAFLGFGHGSNLLLRLLASTPKLSQIWAEISLSG